MQNHHLKLHFQNKSAYSKCHFTIETTGAGDTFCACVLHYVLEHGLEGYSREGLEEMLWFANAAASIITTRKGALRVMPEVSEIRELILKN